MNLTHSPELATGGNWSCELAAAAILDWRPSVYQCRVTGRMSMSVFLGAEMTIYCVATPSFVKEVSANDEQRECDKPEPFRAHEGLPNGSRLSCGRKPGGRKAAERQTKRWLARQRNSSHTSARQLQALVRRLAGAEDFVRSAGR